MASACTALAGLSAAPLSLASSKTRCSTKFASSRPAVLRRHETRQCVRASAESREGSNLRHAIAAGALAAALATGSPMMTPQVAFAEPAHVYQLAASDNISEEVNEVLSDAPSNVRNRIEARAADVEEPKKAAFALTFPPIVLISSVGLILVTAAGLSQIFGTAKK